jgi:hypothetical protein
MRAGAEVACSTLARRSGPSLASAVRELVAKHIDLLAGMVLIDDE